MRGSRGSRELAIAQVLFGLAVASLGLGLTYFGYLWGSTSPNPGELFGPALFFGSVLFVLFSFPLRGAARTFGRSVRTKLGAAVFIGYLSAHLVLYGFLLEEILAASYGSAFLAVPTYGWYVYTDVFYPPSITSALFDLSYNPSILVTVLPVFTAAFSAYSVAVALVIAVLVVANVAETRKVARLCSLGKRARSYFLVPTLGIVLGASCCLSVASLVSLYTLPLSLAAAVSANALVYYVTCIFLPAFAAAILYLNLRAVRKIGDGLSP